MSVGQREAQQGQQQRAGCGQGCGEAGAGSRRLASAKRDVLWARTPPGAGPGAALSCVHEGGRIPTETPALLAEPRGRRTGRQAGRGWAAVRRGWLGKDRGGGGGDVIGGL